MSDSEDDFDDDPSLDEEPIHRAAREGDLAVLRRELDALEHDLVLEVHEVALGAVRVARAHGEERVGRAAVLEREFMRG